MAQFRTDRDPEELKDAIGTLIRDYKEYHWSPDYYASDEDKIDHLPSDAEIEDLIYTIGETIDIDYSEDD